MEASAAGLAGPASGDGEAAQNGQQAPAQGQQEGQQQAPQGDAAIAQMAEQMAAMSGTQEEMRAFLQAQAEQIQQTQTATQQEQQQQIDTSFLEDTSLTPQQAAERLQTEIDKRAEIKAQALVDARVAPLEQSIGTMQQNQEADALVAEFPDLGKPEVAQAVLQEAERWATAIQQPEMAHNAQFLKMTYMVGRAAQLAQEQGAAGAPNAATLEGAGGASPGGAGQGASQQQETSDSIAAKWGERKSVLPKF